MTYPIFIFYSVTAACIFAAVCLGALWLLAPRLLARAGLGELRGKAPVVGEAPVYREAPGDDSRITFAVRREQLKMLAGMLHKETPENIAIVLSRMPAGLRQDLLSLLDKDLAQRALVSLAAVRFVGKDMLQDLKQEIEKRLDGVVGGVKEAVELIASLPYAERREILRQLEQGDPQLASEARAFIILDEDLLSLSESDMGVLAAALPPAEMAGLLRSLPDKLQDRIKERLDPKVLEAAEQEGETRSPGAKKKSEDLEKFMAAAAALAASGRIARPAPRAKAPPAAVRAAAASSDW